MITSPDIYVPASTDAGWHVARELQQALTGWRTCHNAGARRRVREAIRAYREMIGSKTVPLCDILLLAIKAQVARQQVSRFTYG